MVLSPVYLPQIPVGKVVKLVQSVNFIIPPPQWKETPDVYL